MPPGTPPAHADALIRPSGPTDSAQHESESGCFVNGYHFAGYGASLGGFASGRASASATGTGNDGASPAAATAPPTFMNVRRSISGPELIASPSTNPRNAGQLHRANSTSCTRFGSHRSGVRSLF